MGLLCLWFRACREFVTVKLLVTFLAALLLSAVLTGIFLSWLDKRRIGADSNHRSMHTGRVATGGGLPLLAAALLVAVSLWPLPGNAAVLLSSVAVLTLLSWLDDLIGLPSALRLLVQLAVTAAAIMVLPEHALVFQGALPLGADRLLAGIALLWFINLYNFMDGIDGIAGVETVSITLGYALVLYAAGQLAGAPLVPLAIAIAGASIGFLSWNWHPARIFMGDVGAVPLGFLTGWLMLDLAVTGQLAAALILPLYFAADATITLLKRIRAGEKPWNAHRQHAYQRAAMALGRHDTVARLVAVCNAALALYAVVSLGTPWLGFVLALGSVAILLESLREIANGTPARAVATAEPPAELPAAGEADEAQASLM